MNDKGNIVDTITTDKRGQAVSKMLPCMNQIYILRGKTTKNGVCFGERNTNSYTATKQSKKKYGNL